MKKPGSTSEFIGQRNRELYAHFLELLRTSKGVPLRAMFSMAAHRPASRFWVSEERAMAVVSARLKGLSTFEEKMFDRRRDMYDEITRRVRRLLTERPELCLTHAVGEVILSPAPEFYLSDESARLIIYRHRQLLKLSKP